MIKTALVIVESPTKARTIKKFLPKTFQVEASMGHIRDLPQSATEIPLDLKKQEWTKIGVNVQNDFDPLYVIPRSKTKVVAQLKKKLKDAEVLYLATDEDREGESISWHLIEVLKPKVPIKRMVFHEITRSAIEKSIENCRDVDLRLVRAQETRRILDRLVGYTLSPLLWKKIAFGLSAGRVQSVGLRLIVQRERERLVFVKAEYWDLSAELNQGDQSVQAKLQFIGSQKIAASKDFDETTGKLSNTEVILLDEQKARDLTEKLKTKSWTVKQIDEKPFQSKPAPPFITSTLQQEANRKLGLSSRDTMRIAQKLYEEGLITYMRTDSPALSQEALAAARNAVLGLYGKDFLSMEIRQYSSKSESAQESHEAIRPAGSEFVHPKNTSLTGRELSVYTLIWKRTVATQMAEAQKLSVTIRILADDCEFASSGTRIIFPGFLRAYVEGNDQAETTPESQEVILPEFHPGEQLNLVNLSSDQHETKPPNRFSEASLIQILEKEGVGRPSTYASIIDTILERGYVRRIGNTLFPTFTGFAVTQLLERNFQRLVDVNFTSEMEKSLDNIAEGKLDWLPYLKKFYLGKNGLQEDVWEGEKKINPNESRTIELPTLKGVIIKVGRFGAYLVHDDDKNSKEEIHATIPEDIAPGDLTDKHIQELLELQKKGPQTLGLEPKSQLPIYMLTGRFGPYLQLGELVEGQPKPKRASIPKTIDYKTLTFETAIRLLSLPRELGIHPQTQKPIVANIGRFGPYIVHDNDFRSLKKTDDVYKVELSRALELLAMEKRTRSDTSTLVRELGVHGDTQKKIAIYNGKYGLFIRHGTKNVALPHGSDPEKFTLEEALTLLQTRKRKSR